MGYRGHTQGSNYNNQKRSPTKRKPFPKKQLNQIVAIESKLNEVHKDIDFEEHSGIFDDVSNAQSDLWKAITKADKTRE